MTNTITYKGKTVYLDEDPRTGVCNGCRAVLGEINTQNGKRYHRMHSHHEIYNDADPEAHTIEFCPMCHARADKERPDKTAQYVIDYDLVRVSRQTWRILTSMGSKKETYDQIIGRLIKFYKEKHHPTEK